jgi:hypothetical protein
MARTIDRPMDICTDQQQTNGNIGGQIGRQANLWIDGQTNKRLIDALTDR